MKIAFLILAHNDFEHLARLVSKLDAIDCDIYVHIDKKSPQPKLEGVTFVEERIAITWGGFSIVQATLNLLQAAHRVGGYSHYALLSGADYPIRPLSELQRYLAAHDADHITSSPMGSPTKSFSRVLVYRMEGPNWRTSLSAGSVFRALVNRSAYMLYRRTGLVRRLPVGFERSSFHAGWQWFCLRASSVHHVLNFVETNPGFVRFCRRTTVPDEFFFQTVLMQADQPRILPNLHFTDWSEGAWHPAVLTERHLPHLRQASRQDAAEEGPLFFARKFSSTQSAHLLDALDLVLGNGVGESAPSPSAHDPESAQQALDHAGS